VAASYLLDSNTIIAGIKGEPHALLNRLAGLASSRLFISSLVFAELQLGAEKSSQAARAHSVLQIFIDGMEVLPFGAEDAMAYARIRAALERKGQAIGPLDMLIAAQALARDLVMVTDNVREFKCVPGLVVENWLR
jgi:tRNA(fMet)-specific endonuclease VapC